MFGEESILGTCSWKTEHGDLENQGQNKHFSENGSPGQTTMLTRRASKFCVKPRSPFSKISHHDPKTIGKTAKIVPLPECQPELLGYVHFTFFTLFSYYFHIF